MTKFIPAISQAISDELKHSSNMTFHKFGQFAGINTLKFRQAIQYYVKALYGYKHDDYDYQKTNTIFTRDGKDGETNLTDTKSAKSFIKKLATDPGSSNKEDYDKMTEKFDFYTSEFIHIIILIENTKFDVSLVYFIKALDEYFKEKR